MGETALLFLLLFVVATRALDMHATKKKCDQSLARANRIPGGIQILAARRDRSTLRWQYPALTFIQDWYILILMVCVWTFFGILGALILIAEPSIVLAIGTLIVSFAVSAFNLLNESFRWGLEK